MVVPFSHPGIVFYWAMKHDRMEWFSCGGNEVPF